MGGSVSAQPAAPVAPEPAPAAPAQYEAPAAPVQEVAPVEQYAETEPLPTTGGVSPVALAFVALASVGVIGLLALRRRA